ncbi:MAG: nickel insertion protein [Cellulosilyticaceae bacterium]
MTGEMAGYAMERLLGTGALDVFYTPIYMKKNRPAMKLGVICNQEQLEDLKKEILRHTTTIGIRAYEVERTCMNREFLEVVVRGEIIHIKVASYEEVVKYMPEYEDCKKVATSLNLNLNEIYQEAVAVAKSMKREC